MTKIKYCGIKSIEETDVINNLDIDYVGFVFAKNSKRYITEKQALLLKQNLNSRIKTVGVFTDADIDEIVNYYKKGIIDIAQLHANESEEYIAKIRSRCDVEIIKAFALNMEADVTKANNSTADMVLLDSTGGGTGKKFNWELLEGITRDYFLAGGLNTDNIKEALNMRNLFAVDVSSGIESNGKKDKEKMTIFASIVREENNG